MTIEKTTRKSPINLQACIVITALVTGLALAPGYLLLCGHSSGRKVASYAVIQGLTDGNLPQSASLSIPLNTKMNPLGFNVIIETPFRDHARTETLKLGTSLNKNGRQIWESDFSLGHGKKKETVAGTTFVVRARSFAITEDGEYQFTFASEGGLDKIRSVVLEIRKNVMLPNRWIVGLGFLIIAGVVVWAIIPAKGYDPKSERTGTQWYED